MRTYTDVSLVIVFSGSAMLKMTLVLQTICLLSLVQQRQNTE